MLNKVISEIRDEFEGNSGGRDRNKKGEVEQLKERFAGFSDLREPGEYSIKRNSDVFVSWSGPGYLVECKVRGEMCMIQKRSRETGQVERKTVSTSPESAIEMAYLMME